MFKSLNKIVDAGVAHAQQNTLLRRKYVLTNILCLVLAFSTLPFVFVFYSSVFFFSVTTFFFFLLFLSGILFNYKGLINVSRNIVLLGWALGIFTYSLFLGFETGLQYCFFSLTAAPFIIFSPKEASQKYFHVILGVLLYFLVELQVISHFFERLINFETAKVIGSVIKPTVLIQIILIFYYYSFQEKELVREITNHRKLNNSLRANSTELLNFSAKLKKSENSLNSLLNSLDDVVLEVNKDGGIMKFWTSINKEIELGSCIDKYFGNYMKIKIVNAFSQFNGDYFNKVYEYSFSGKNYQFKINPVNHIDSPEVSAVVAIRDVTINRRMADEYNEIKKEKELAIRSADFKESFLANVSHEIRTPLNGVVGMIDLLKDTPLNNTQKDYLETLSNSSENLLVLINDVLDLSKIQAGEMVLKLQDSDICKLLNNSVDLFTSMANEKGLKLILHIDNKIPQFLRLDPTRLSQVLNNLISNAVKFTDSGCVTIKALKVNEGVKFIVEDTGEGIPVDVQKSVFQKFTQLENNNSQIKGTGLGLNIVSQLVEIMGGEIKISSEPGKGASFYFTLNLKKAGNPQYLNITKELTDDLKGRQVLLVDDINVNRKVASIMLKKLGAIVTEAANGVEAIEATNFLDFDLVLMDIQMPVMNGEEALKKIKLNGFSRPVIALSANALEGDEERYLKQGFDGYISKPLTLKKLELGIIKYQTVSN